MSTIKNGLTRTDRVTRRKCMGWLPGRLAGTQTCWTMDQSPTGTGESPVGWSFMKKLKPNNRKNIRSNSSLQANSRAISTEKLYTELSRMESFVTALLLPLLHSTTPSLCRGKDLSLSLRQHHFCNHSLPSFKPCSASQLGTLPACKMWNWGQQNYLLHLKMTGLLHSVETADICYVLNRGKLAGFVFWIFIYCLLWTRVIQALTRAFQITLFWGLTSSYTAQLCGIHTAVDNSISDYH